jgi:catechol 2,3-dioxygenase-like lactoylglutathione lyase family enzyme
VKRWPERVACAALLTITWLHAGAQTAAAPQLLSLPAPQSAALSSIAHVAIRVGDLERSRAFYRSLGYEEAFAMDAGGSPTEAFFKINDRQFIELYPRRQPEQALGFMHVCFEAPDLNALHQEYEAQGLTPTPVRKAGAGNLLFTLQGPEEPGLPEGLRPQATQNIEYTQYMPGSRHTLDRGKHLGANRIAEEMVGVTIPVNDSAAATEYYLAKLSFQRIAHPVERGIPALALPSAANDFIELVAPNERAPNVQPLVLPLRVLFAVPDLKAASRRLRALGLHAGIHHNAIEVEDPDGNQLIFIRSSR